MFLQRLNSRSAIIHFVVLTTIVLFTYTAFDKLIHLSLFNETMIRAGIYPWLSGIISFMIPAIELIIVTTLLFSKTSEWGLLAAFILMILFTVYTGTLLAINKHLPCSCGGIISLLSWKQHLIFNIGYTLLLGATVLINIGWGNAIDKRGK